MTLSVRSLTVEYTTTRGTRTAVDDLSFTIARGEAYGLVGESGSGKSTAAAALVRHLADSAVVRSGEIDLSGTDVLALEPEPLRQYRSQRVSTVYQEPGRALNPTMRVGVQIAEALAVGARGRIPATGSPEVLDLLDRVGLPSPDLLGQRYPHQLSGGQAQRVVIAMALAVQPELLILDEPTTGLDVQVEASILGLVNELRSELDAAVLLISHNLPLVGAHCDRVGVLRNGVLVEEGVAGEVLTRPRHEYTRTLVEALPDIDAPKPQWLVREDSPVVVSVRGLRKTYGNAVAVAGVDLDIRQGEVVAVVGESGSGKTTLGRAIAGLTDHHGVVDVFAPSSHRHPVQVVFQSPDATLNPRRSARRILARAIRLLGGESTVEELADRVGLEPELLDRLPGELSGGQKQRVAIARAFAGPSSLVVCDEPVSALDVSVQARILALLRELQVTSGVSYLFISHDLAVVRALADRVVVMRSGVVLESGPADQIYANPQHPYTRTLIEAARYGSLGNPVAAAARPVPDNSERMAWHSN
ncbi:peptide/nickel transport system ATP-binding protein [Rhodococcus sp. 27YEA15]|uniref:ATP-binding cassette domain-containing protein n=1 Tax=Rhodococcus sp. 27YEA15 TaxID=3156259 RepID=UPI003C7B8749